MAKCMTIKYCPGCHFRRLSRKIQARHPIPHLGNEYSEESHRKGFTINEKRLKEQQTMRIKAIQGKKVVTSLQKALLIAKNKNGPFDRSENHIE